jgi:hypothetical protein
MKFTSRPSPASVARIRRGVLKATRSKWGASLTSSKRRSSLRARAAERATVKDYTAPRVSRSTAGSRRASGGEAGGLTRSSARPRGPRRAPGSTESSVTLRAELPQFSEVSRGSRESNRPHGGCLVLGPGVACRGWHALVDALDPAGVHLRRWVWIDTASNRRWRGWCRWWAGRPRGWDVRAGRSNGRRGARLR